MSPVTPSGAGKSGLTRTGAGGRGGAVELEVRAEEAAGTDTATGGSREERKEKGLVRMAL